MKFFTNYEIIYSFCMDLIYIKEITIKMIKKDLLII